MGRAEHDLLVVGGGPAGLATAIRAVLSGLEVVVVDRRRPPIDKACGEGLMPDGVERLRALGVENPAAMGVPFGGIRYVDGDISARGVFPGGAGLGIRRPTLHEALVRRAGEVGVDLRWGVVAHGLTVGGIETDHGVVRARWLVAADGLKSRLRRSVGGAVRPARLLRRFGVRRHFATTPWTDLVEVHWGDRCEAYVTPVGPELVGVALIWGPGKGSFDALISRFPELCERLSGAPVASRDRGAGPFEQRCRTVVRGNLALVGDASGYLDPITGEGLALAFHQASAVIDALCHGDLRGYARAHRRIGRLPWAMTRLLLLLEQRPRLRRRVMSSLAADPELFSRLLGVHARQLGMATAGAGAALGLGWSLATRRGRS